MSNRTAPALAALVAAACLAFGGLSSAPSSAADSLTPAAPAAEPTPTAPPTPGPTPPGPTDEQPTYEQLRDKVVRMEARIYDLTTRVGQWRTRAQNYRRYLAYDTVPRRPCQAEDGPGPCFWDAGVRGLEPGGRSFWIGPYGRFHYLDGKGRRG
jgi:hypothetical protein